jgi:hypothetical protein
MVAVRGTLCTIPPLNSNSDQHRRICHTSVPVCCFSLCMWRYLVKVQASDTSIIYIREK